MTRFVVNSWEKTQKVAIAPPRQGRYIGSQEHPAISTQFLCVCINNRLCLFTDSTAIVITTIVNSSGSMYRLLVHGFRMQSDVRCEFMSETSWISEQKMFAELWE